MSTLDRTLWRLDQTNRLAEANTWIHRLDPRTKLLTTMVFVLLVVSHDRLQVSTLTSFTIYPIFLLIAADLPLSYLARRLLLAAPFVMFLGIFNPILETQTILIAGWEVRQGWLSMASILMRFFLTATATLMLLATTTIPQLCNALSQLGVPRVFTRQLQLLHRYLFVLINEGLALHRATKLRSYGRQRLTLRTGTNLLGQLLLRTTARANRIHQAMLSRNFTDQIHPIQSLKITWHDWGFFLGWSGVFVLMRNMNLPLYLGQLLEGCWL